jgi:hypothetical protein
MLLKSLCLAPICNKLGVQIKTVCEIAADALVL